MLKEESRRRWEYHTQVLGGEILILAVEDDVLAQDSYLDPIIASDRIYMQVMNTYF